MSFQSDLISTVQARLAELGYYSGKIDGVAGKLTSLAITQFKTDNGFADRDYPGKLTLAALFDPKAKAKPPAKPLPEEPLWITEAKSLYGVKEIPGEKSNPIIMDWAKDIDQWYPDDSVAWCGLFVAHCMSVGAPLEPQDFNRLGAREWLKYGDETDPSYGSIAVFWRVSPSAWQGHVGFIVGADSTTYHVLGGNQADSVSLTRISKTRLLGCRGPKGWKGSKVLKPVTFGQLSTNEG